MKNVFALSTLLLFCSVMLSSCEVIGGIFKAGMWVGILIVVFILGIIGYFVSKKK